MKLLLLGLALIWSAVVAAEPPAGQNEGLQWLQRVTAAVQKLNYSGTFVYRNGAHSETSRIVHLAGDGRQSEKLEVLDGSPREVIRSNGEVRCYLPEKHLVIVEQRSVHRSFPALLPMSLARLAENYQVRLEGGERVAGFDSRIVRLEPRDAWRYGHRFWIDTASGLLLKAEIFDAQGQALESMAFTELRLGLPMDRAAVEPSFAVGGKDWQVRSARLRDLRDDAQWLFRAELPGFHRRASMRRSTGKHGEEVDTLHWVFSDDLVALSVFISPLRQPASAGDGEVGSMGALSVMKRVLDGHEVVVMGDVPPESVRHFATGIAVRSK